MFATATGVDYKSAPPDYAALFQIYYPYIVNLVAKNGIDDNNKEDVASDILMRLIEHDFLADFDPDLVFEYEGQPRPARFKSFLARIVYKYVRGYYDKQKRLAAREIQICDNTIGDSDQQHGMRSGGSWIDLFGPANADFSDDVIEMIGEEQDSGWLRTWLSTRERRSSHDRCDLVELFDAVRAQVLSTGFYNIADLEKQFSLSTTTMYTWLWWLKSNVAAAYGRATPPKRRRVLKTEP